MLSIPSWWLSLSSGGHAEIEILFSSLLAQMPLTTAELASQMGVNQSTISRWGMRKARPSLKHMIRASEIIAAEMERLNHFAQEVSEAIQVVNQLNEHRREKATPSRIKRRKAQLADLEGHVARGMVLIGEERLDPWAE